MKKIALKQCEGFLSNRNPTKNPNKNPIEASYDKTELLAGSPSRVGLIGILFLNPHETEEDKN
jgi:hypothetical protein